jgi:hypothetical protein
MSLENFGRKCENQLKKIILSLEFHTREYICLANPKIVAFSQRNNYLSLKVSLEFSRGSYPFLETFL